MLLVRNARLFLVCFVDCSQSTTPFITVEARIHTCIYIYICIYVCMCAARYTSRRVIVATGKKRHDERNVKPPPPVIVSKSKTKTRAAALWVLNKVESTQTGFRPPIYGGARVGGKEGKWRLWEAQTFEDRRRTSHSPFVLLSFFVLRRICRLCDAMSFWVQAAASILLSLSLPQSSDAHNPTLYFFYAATRCMQKPFTSQPGR
jgi:hypothetical protein